MNMEAYWAVAALATGLIDIIVMGFMLGIFYKPFLKHEKRYFVIALAYVVTMGFLYIVPYELNSVIAYGIGALSITVVSVLADAGNFMQKIFLGFTAYLIRWIAGGVVILPQDWLYGILINNPRVEQESHLQFALFIVITLLIIAMESALCYVMIYLIHRAYLHKSDDMGRKELLLLLSPYLTVVSGYWLISYMTDTYAADTQTFIWNPHPGYMWFTTVFQILSFVAILTALMSYEKIKSAQEERLERLMLAEQVKELEAHVTEVESLYQGIRGMKHDLNNHIIVLQDLHEKGSYDEAREYLSEMKKGFSEVDFAVKTGNPVTDVILMEKQKEAAEKGIEFKAEFFLPERAKKAAYDISIILTNTLANAIEAAEKSEERWITVKSKMQNDMLFIDVSNSFDGVLQIREDSGLPATTKAVKGEHGIGFLNVKKAAEKYFGGVNIEQDRKSVRVTVLMVLPE